MEKTRKIIRISRRKLIISVLVILLILGFLIYFGLMRLGRPMMTSQYNNTGGMQAPSYPYDKELNVNDQIYPQMYQENSTIEDTREFLKTNYTANIKTRDVHNVMSDVKNLIRDASGRIDRMNEGDKSGYIGFVVPKSNYENFRDEIESITNKKLIAVSINSENLLTQKQSIEQQQQSASDFLAQLEQQQKDLTSKHTQTKNKLQNELTSLENQLISIELNPPAEYVALRQDLSNKITLKKQQLASENSSFNTNNQNLKNQIDGVNSQLTSIERQDINFTNNIETVNGTVYVEWISFWKIAKIFSPIHPTLIVIILIIVLWYLLKRKSYIPKVEFV